ncbi:MAG: type II toxin-antitoxin system VapC family toxin [Thermoanaerobaculia bacterium]|nr:type II toxin-antitoxin system VapC family toxin [Thermoanaerobaculia bacterium]
MTRGLLDTSVLIARDDEPQLESVFPEEVAISVATLAELHYGVLVAKDELTRKHRLRRLGVIEAAFEPIPIDTAIARAFASLAHEVKSAGRQPRGRVMDLWIAATAMALRLPLYTRNADDFKGLQQLVEVRIV